MAVFIEESFLTNTPESEMPLRYPRIGHQTYTRQLSPSDVTASSAEAGFPADAPLRPDTYERWQPTVSGATWELDLGGERNVSYIAIAAHTVGSSGATVSVEYRSGTQWAELMTFSPTTDSAIMALFDTVSTTRVRLTFDGGAPQVGVIYVGEVLEMMRPIYSGHSPITLSRTTNIRTSRSRSGQFLGQDFRRKGFESSASFSNLEPDWVRNEFDAFIEDARIYPYFFAWRPVKYPAEVAFVWTSEDIAPQNSGTRELMNVSWSMEGFDE